MMVSIRYISQCWQIIPVLFLHFLIQIFLSDYCSLTLFFIFTVGDHYLELYGNDGTISTPGSGSRSTLSEEIHQSGNSENVDRRSDHKPYQVSS